MKSEIKTIRRLLAIFMTLLVLSGITAFPLRNEMSFLMKHISVFPLFIQDWLARISADLQVTPETILYGTDWLAFAHLVIAFFFTGVYADPVKNKFIVIAGITACIAVFPLAFTMGPVRGIPFFHQLTDCSFGLFGAVLLHIIYKKINHLEHADSILH